MMILVVIALGFATLVGTVHAALYGPRARARERLRSAPETLTDGAAVTISGTVVARTKIVEAPLSGREGVAYMSCARIYTRGRQPQLAHEIIEATMVEFDLQTKAGTITVEGDSVYIVVARDPLIPRKLGREQRFLDMHGYETVNAAAAGFDEVVIAAGMKVSVHGVLRIEAAPGEASYREAARKVVLAGHPAHPLTIGRPV